MHFYEGNPLNLHCDCEPVFWHGPNYKLYFGGAQVQWILQYLPLLHWELFVVNSHGITPEVTKRNQKKRTILLVLSGQRSFFRDLLSYLSDFSSRGFCLVRLQSWFRHVPRLDFLGRNANQISPEIFDFSENKQTIFYTSHRIDVWYIYLHLVDFLWYM